MTTYRSKKLRWFDTRMVLASRSKRGRRSSPCTWRRFLIDCSIQFAPTCRWRKRMARSNVRRLERPADEADLPPLDRRERVFAEVEEVTRRDVVDRARTRLCLRFRHHARGSVLHGDEMVKPRARRQVSASFSAAVLPVQNPQHRPMLAALARPICRPAHGRSAAAVAGREDLAGVQEPARVEDALQVLLQRDQLRRLLEREIRRLRARRCRARR